MNEFKFADCRDCLHVGKGLKSRFCKDCHAGEYFEERDDELPFSGYDDDGVCDYD